MSPRSTALLLVALLSLAGCASQIPASGPAPVTSSLQGDDARPSSATGWVRSELYFGVGEDTGNGTSVNEAQWRDFLDKQVTPRFPDGLTVFDAYGQWLFRGKEEPNRLRSKVLVILHEDNADRRADIEAIRLAWKQVTGHQSVLWSLQPAEVSF